MKMITDPTPALDPDLPALQRAIHMIRLELLLVQTECPELTPHQQLSEARRRSYRAMVGAADAVEAKQARQRLQETRG
jgi:hypothetical protein